MATNADIKNAIDTITENLDRIPLTKLKELAATIHQANAGVPVSVDALMAELGFARTA